MLPKKFLDRMERQLDTEYPAFLRSYEAEEVRALRVNTLKCGERLTKEMLPFSLTDVPWCPTGFYYDKDDKPGRHPYHDAGVYYIQEASAMVPAEYLRARPGERILDLCAAPGGKSTQIAAAMKQQGLLICNEIHPARAKILSENMERMGVCNALVTNETPQRLERTFPEYFDRILVDAPCSGEGMFRRNEEACAEWSEENVGMCAGRQDEILECAANMLRPGGRLVYSTCTFAPSEDEGTVSRFVRSHPEFTIIPMEKYPGMVQGEEKWIEEPCEHLSDTIRLWPHRLRGEGHYVAVLEKRVVGGERRPLKLQKGLPEREFAAFLEFAREQLRVNFSGIYVRFGEQLYLCPEQTPPLDGLKVLRPGLHLGMLRKNRFEPSHALALALKKEQAVHVLELSSDGQQVQEYLKGATLSAEGEKGWYLINVDGFSLGWGKLSGMVMKNHYPKGLRKF